MKRTLLCGAFALAACSSAPSPSPPILGPVAKAATTVAVEPPAPPATPRARLPLPLAIVEAAGPCPVLPPAEGAPPQSPAAMASCPDPMEMIRGNGMADMANLPAVTPSAMPSEDVEKMRAFACAYACASRDADAYLLAWDVIEDPRPLRNHRAAFAIAHGGASPKPAWTVVLMYRRATNDWWNINVSPHGGTHPIARFAARPTVTQLDKLLDLDGWAFEQPTDPDGFKILAGNVIEEVWPTAAGGQPTRHFPKGIER